MTTDSQSHLCESFSSVSDYSSDSYGSKSKKDHVSKWTKNDLDDKNIFYCDEACSLDEFVQRVKERVCPKQGNLFKCPADIPDFMKNLVRYTKASLWFSYDEDFEEDFGKEPTFAAYHEACKNQTDFEAYSCLLMDEHKELDHTNRKLLTSWCSTVEAFIIFLKLFLSTKLRNEEESELKGQFRELLMTFTRIFFMTPENGNARKRELEIDKVRVFSVPDIHYIKDTGIPKMFGTLLVVSVEVMVSGFYKSRPDQNSTPIMLATEMKNHHETHNSTPGRTPAKKHKKNPDTHLKAEKAAKDHSTITLERFKANEMISSSVLGQHGGELLLEKTYSVFEPKVLGMICHRSKILFTYMDLKSSHYKVILEKGEVTDDKHLCTIYYTRPYDFLIKRDRDEIIEFLFWIGNMQATDTDDCETKS